MSDEQPRDERPREFWPVEHDPAATYDLLGRKQPHRIGFMQCARQFPGYVAQFRSEVPPEFTVRVETDVTEVACPCGQTPRLRWNLPTACACDRVFVLIAGRVLVAYIQPEEQHVAAA